jgi:exonuclease VII large subunit
MPGTSTLSELAKKLEQKKRQEAEERARIERQTLSYYAELLKSDIERELATTKSAIQRRSEEIGRELRRTAETAEEAGKEIRKRLRSLNKQTAQEIEAQEERLKSITARKWIAPALMAASIVIGLAGGLWGITAYLSHRIQSQTEELGRLKKLVKDERALANRYIIRTWNNAIGVRKKPILWQDKDGLWIVEFEQPKGD